MPFKGLLDSTGIHQGCHRFSLVVEQVGSPPVQVGSGHASTAKCFVFYDTSAHSGVVLMVDGNHMASITNAADVIIPFVHRKFLSTKGIRWRGARWVYRDSLGQWDEIVVDSWDGGNLAMTSFKPLGGRTIEDAVSLLAKSGFYINGHDLQHIRLAINSIPS